MSFKPISYLQTDARWASLSYATSAEKTTIGGSGCGPTAAAMVVAEWCGIEETPETACAWALEHGYKATGQGTYYSFFEPYFTKYGLPCTRLNSANVYGNTSAAAHLAAYNAVKQGDYIIACMGKGNWTSSGHFVLWYGIDGDNVLINDPASTKAERLRASWSLFKSQVKYYFKITKPTTFKTSGDCYTVSDKDGYLNVRYGAGTSYAIFGESKNGAVLQIDKTEGSWGRTVENGVRYYVHLAGLRKGGNATMTTFSDIEGHWAKTYIEELCERGILSGYEDGTFRPDTTMTRAELAAALSNVLRQVG